MTTQDVKLENLRLTFIMKYFDAKGEWPNTDDIDRLVTYVTKSSGIISATAITNI